MGRENSALFSSQINNISVTSLAIFSALKFISCIDSIDFCFKARMFNILHNQLSSFAIQFDHPPCVCSYRVFENATGKNDPNLPEKRSRWNPRYAVS